MRYRLSTLMIVLAAAVSLPLLGQDKSDLAKALYGEWEVVEMIYRATPQDFRGQNGGWFLFKPEGFIRSFNKS